MGAALAVNTNVRTPHSKHVLKRLLVYTASGHGLASSALALGPEHLMKQSAATVTLYANICSFC